MNTKVKVGADSEQQGTESGPFVGPFKDHKKSQEASTIKNQVSAVMLFGIPIVSLIMDGKERLCLAQISSTLLKEFSYNEIHNRRVALGITCIQCTPVQLEILRRAGAMPVTSRRCGMITRREAERLCQSFLGDHAPPQLPENFAFEVYHECAWGCRGHFVPSRYNSSRAKCIRCSFCQLFFSPNKFIFHSHRLPDSRYIQPDAANFNSWRRHLRLCGDPPEDVSSLSPSSASTFKHIPSGDLPAKHKSPVVNPSSIHSDDVIDTAQIVHAWEDVKAMFNGGTRKRLLAVHSSPSPSKRTSPPKISPEHSRATSSTSGGGSPERLRPPSHHQMIVNGQSTGSQRSPVEGSVFMTPMPGSPPFLNPTNRIWNPGVATVADKVPRCHLDPSQLHTLPLAFHPLSMPWLRRPPFPFGHPVFDGHSKYISEPGLLVDTESIRKASAFKPVRQHQSAAEQIFSTWLNTSALHSSNGVAQVPEDLSLTSNVAAVVATSNPLYYFPSGPSSNLPTRFDPKFSLQRFKDSKMSPDNQEFSGEKSPKVEDSHSTYTSDEETVDVESTDSEPPKVDPPSATPVLKRGQSDDGLGTHRHGYCPQRHKIKLKKKRPWGSFDHSSRCVSPE